MPLSMPDIHPNQNRSESMVNFRSPAERENISPRNLFRIGPNQKNSLTRVIQPTQKLSMIPNDFKWLKLDPMMIFRVYGFKITWFHNHVVIQRVSNYRLDPKCLNNIIFRFFSHLEKINWCRIWSICYV